MINAKRFSFALAMGILCSQYALFADEGGAKAPPAVSEAVVKVEEFTLEVPNEKKELIVELVSTMGTTSTIGLGFKKSHLEEIGRELRGVGPLHFLGYIFSRQDLKTHMKKIRKSSFKWNGFMKGLTPGMKRAYNNQTLMNRLPGFASYLKVSAEPLQKAAQQQDWHQFVEILINS